MGWEYVSVSVGVGVGVEVGAGMVCLSQEDQSDGNNSSWDGTKGTKAGCR